MIGLVYVNTYRSIFIPLCGILVDFLSPGPASVPASLNRPAYICQKGCSGDDGRRVMLLCLVPAGKGDRNRSESVSGNLVGSLLRRRVADPDLFFSPRRTPKRPLRQGRDGRKTAP